MTDQPAKPRAQEVHTAPVQTPLSLPPALQEDASRKTPAQWAYERVINYIRNFEDGLDADHEVGMGLVGGEQGSMTIEGVGYFDPDIITFYGFTPTGARTQLIQHVTQLNVMLVASPKMVPTEDANRIGFRLTKELEGDAPAST